MNYHPTSPVASPAGASTLSPCHADMLHLSSTLSSCALPVFVTKSAQFLSFGFLWVPSQPVACRQWTVEQIEHAKKGSVAVLYASAYGNTAGMAQAISRGITKAGIAVETLNLEVDSIDDALDAVKRAKGFIIGSPTLGGHLPTQVSCPVLGLLHSVQCVEDLPAAIAHIVCNMCLSPARIYPPRLGTAQQVEYHLHVASNWSSWL